MSNTRVTEKVLQKELATLNKIMKGIVNGEYEIDYAACYGGWSITKNSYDIMRRVSAKEMLCFIKGMIQANIDITITY